MRKIFFMALCLLLLCVCSCYADVTLYRGANNIGSVKTIDAKNNSGYFVPVDEVGRLLGFSSRRSGDELILTRANTQLRVILNSAGAWRGFTIVPLQSAPFEQDGKLWLDSASVLSLFQASIGREQSNKLSFQKNSGYIAAAPTARTQPDITPQRTAAQNVQNTRRSASSEAGIFDSDDSSSKINADSKTDDSSSENIDAKIAAMLSPDKNTRERKTQLQAKNVKESSKPAQTRKAYPRRETFNPGDSGKVKAENYSGTIQGIRWTDQEGTYKKIRAVVTTDDNADPQVFMTGGKLHALFESSLENSKTLASPYPNIKTELKRDENGAELIFSPEGITRAEKIILSSPRRVVFDFFLPENANIAAETSKETKPDINLSELIKESESENLPAAKTDKITIVNNAPQTTVRPGNITITPSPDSVKVTTAPAVPAVRQNSNKKVIVVDPGHGGKDPGASGNGVIEKNINLAIGLALENILSSRGYNVVMTRRTDVYLQLQERTDIANASDADLFVSVHVNALPSKRSMTGFEIYIMALPTDNDAMNLAKVENREYVEGKGVDVENVDRRTEMLLRILGDMQQNNKISESTDFAASLYNAGARNGLQMRRVAQAPFFVLRGAGMPAVLLETGFLTNANEARLLSDPRYQQKIAQAMAEGIATYLQ